GDSDGEVAWVHVDEETQTINVYFMNDDGTMPTTPSATTDLGLYFRENGLHFRPRQVPGDIHFMKDVTGDGIADWVYGTSGNGGRIYVVEGRADGTFDVENVKVTDMSSVGDYNWATAGQGNSSLSFLADVTGDGVVDWVNGNSGSTGLRVFEGNGDGTFSTTPITTDGNLINYANWSFSSYSYLAYVGDDTSGGMAWVTADHPGK